MVIPRAPNGVSELLIATALETLEKEGVVEIHLPEGKDDAEEALLSGYMPIEFMMQQNLILLKILPAFYRKYYWYSLISLGENNWNIINPIWIVWQLIKSIVFLVEWLWEKSRVIVIVSGLSALFVYDYSLAWKNLKFILIWILSR